MFQKDTHLLPPFQHLSTYPAPVKRRIGIVGMRIELNCVFGGEIMVMSPPSPSRSHEGDVPQATSHGV